MTIKNSVTYLLTFKWKDRLVSNIGVKVTFTIDSVKDDAWASYKEEASFVQTKMQNLTNSSSIATTEQTFKYVFAKASTFAVMFCKEMKCDYNTYCKFMSCLCIQMAYHQSPTKMYDRKTSLLIDHLPMNKDDFLNFWNDISNKDKVTMHSYLSSSRRSKCLWEFFQIAVNEVMREICVTERHTHINISLDDDLLSNLILFACHISFIYLYIFSISF